MRAVWLESTFPVKALETVVEHEPTVPWANGGDPSFLRSLSESTPGVLCPGLGCSEQERSRCSKESPEKGHKDAEQGCSPYDRSRDWLFSLEMEDIEVGGVTLIMCIQYVMEETKEDEGRLFSMICSEREGDASWKTQIFT